jgi:Ca2+-binding EF-hand superfamily protein
MQTLASKLIPVAIASILCGVAVAGGGKDHKLSMMDKDGDGKVSATEHAQGSKLMFAKMDANKDGAVTAEEMDAAWSDEAGAQGQQGQQGHSNQQATARAEGAQQQRMGDKKAYDPSGTGKAMPKRMSSSQKIAAMDANNDGKLTEQEYAAGSKKLFSKMDTDGDGVLSAQELSKAERATLTASDE